MINWSFSLPIVPPMNTLTQYGLMAEKHWREHCPNLVRELESRGLLRQMLLEAEEKTKDEMATLRTQLMTQDQRRNKPKTRLGKW